MGWLLSYLYALTLGAPIIETCTMASDDGWRVALLLGVPAAAAALVLLVIGLPARAELKWLAMPHLLTLALAVPEVVSELRVATLGGRHLCDVKVFPDSYRAMVPAWHRWYPLLQLALLGGLVLLAILYWRRRPAAAVDPAAG